MARQTGGQLQIGSCEVIDLFVRLYTTANLLAPIESGVAQSRTGGCPIARRGYCVPAAARQADASVPIASRAWPRPRPPDVPATVAARCMRRWRRSNNCWSRRGVCWVNVNWRLLIIRRVDSQFVALLTLNSPLRSFGKSVSRRVARARPKTTCLYSVASQSLTSTPRLAEESLFLVGVSPSDSLWVGESVYERASHNDRSILADTGHARCRIYGSRTFPQN